MPSLNLVSTDTLRRWSLRLHLMPSWVFLLRSMRTLRIAVEAELLARDMAAIAAELDDGEGYPSVMPQGWH